MYSQGVYNAKYLGVTIDRNLSWTNIGTIIRKANAVHTFLQRNLRGNALHQVLGIPHLCKTHTKRHIASLGKIQGRAAHFVCNNYSRYDSVTNMLNMLKWPSLEQRRKQTKCITFYKIIIK